MLYFFNCLENDKWISCLRQSLNSVPTEEVCTWHPFLPHYVHDKNLTLHVSLATSSSHIFLLQLKNSWGTGSDSDTSTHLSSMFLFSLFLSMVYVLHIQYVHGPCVYLCILQMQSRLHSGRNPGDLYAFGWMDKCGLDLLCKYCA